MNNIFLELFELRLFLSEKRRKQFSCILIMMVFGSLLEVLSIASVLPFLTVLLSPDQILKYPLLYILIDYLNLYLKLDVKILVSIIFAALAFTSIGIRLITLWASTKYSFNVGLELSEDIFRKTLYQPYITHISRNTSEVINGISQVNEVIFYILLPLQNFLISILISILILIAALFFIPIYAMLIVISVGIIYMLITISLKRKLQENSYVIAKGSEQVLKIQQEAFGGIRDILIDGVQNSFCQIMNAADLSRRLAQASNQFISQFPRYFIEALGMTFLIVIAYIVSTDAGLSQNALPLLGILALSMQRLLPSLHQVYASWTTIIGSRSSLDTVLRLLNQKVIGKSNISSSYESFEKSIVLKDLSYRYTKSSPYIFENYNLIINKGDRIGFIGTTGSGKSTLIDLIMGLLEPENGAILIDGEELTFENKQSWYKNIAHVPQDIFLLDSSIKENIAFGLKKSEINNTKLEEVCKQAQLFELIESWPLKYDTIIGERGVQLSGGQRQRIGIARALYKDASILIFDESTSALDVDTESAIVDAINRLGKSMTILIVAHRLSTLESCTRQIRI